jgi:hypothetical protein
MAKNTGEFYMSQTKKNLTYSVLMALAAQAVVPMATTAAHAQQDTTSMAVRSANGQIAALSEAQRTTLRLLIATVLTEQKMGTLVEVDEAVAKKYQIAKATYLGSVPTSGMGIASASLGKTASAEVRFLIEPLTALARASARGLKQSSAGVEFSLRVTGIDQVLVKSSTASVTFVEKVIVPIARIFITKGTMISSAAAGTSGIFAGSMTFITNDSTEIMSWESARNLFGQDKAIRGRIDSLVSDLAAVFDLSPSEQDKLKLSIYDEAMRQAVANKFSTDASKYSLDVVDLMAKNQLISSEEAGAVKKLQNFSMSISAEPSPDMITSISENVDVTLALAALLESQLNSGQLKDPKLRAEIERMLGGLTAKLMLIGFNLKK